MGIEATSGKRPIDGAQDLVRTIAGHFPDEPESDVKVAAGNPPRVDTTLELATQRISDRGCRVTYGIVQLDAEEDSQETVSTSWFWVLEEATEFSTTEQAEPAETKNIYDLR